MADVIIYQTASGNPAIMAAAPDVDFVTLIDDLPAGTLHFTMADTDLPGGGVAAMDVDFNTQSVAAKPIVILKAMVNAESKRRIHELIGATNDQESNEKQANLQVEYMAILDVLMDGGTLTAEQVQRRAIIKAGNDRIKQIRTFSNDLIAMAVIPLDYTDDKYWV